MRSIFEGYMREGKIDKRNHVGNCRYQMRAVARLNEGIFQETGEIGTSRYLIRDYQRHHKPIKYNDIVYHLDTSLLRRE